MSDKIITIGADPELFVSVDGTMVSAFGLVGGTKYAPQLVDKGAVQVDGMALEFNIDPAKTEDEFLTNVTTVLGELRKLIPAEYNFEIVPVAEFGADYIQAQPKLAKEMGCEPDFNGYTGEVNEKPNAEAPFRTAAGHVHIGVEGGLTDLEQMQLVVLCDLLLGLPSVSYDTNAKRRELYGKAGCYRPKSYGIEYRTLSNLWVGDEELTKLTFQRAKKAVELLPRFEEVITLVEKHLGHDYTLIPTIIDNSLAPTARKLHATLSKEFNYV